jgi:flagellin
MALTINTNVASIRGNRALDATQRELGRAVERISSGIKLNSAKDDPSGLATADRLSAQIRGIAVAIQNANEGITLAQTAEGALQEVSNILQRMQELAVQASNPANGVAARASLQAEMSERNQAIIRIANETEYNGKSLLSGDIINAVFQVGTRPEHTINFSIPSISSLNLGNFFSSTDNTALSAADNTISASIGQAILGGNGSAPLNNTTAQDISIRGFNSGSVASILPVEDEETALSIVTKINAIEARTGVVASASTSLTLEGVYDTDEAGNQEISFRLYGKNAKAGGTTLAAETISATVTGITKEGLTPLIGKINDVSGTTGISATFVSDGVIQLSNNDGSDISLEGFTNSATRNDPATGEVDTDTLTVTGAEGTIGVTLSDGDRDSVTVGGSINFSSSRPFSVSSSITATEGSLFRNSNPEEQVGSQFSALGNVNVSSLEGAAEAIRITADAQEQISSLRGNLGAVQNRFESTISNLESIKENTESSRSRIMDTDFAEEVSRFTRAQILQQAGIAILAQANAAPFAVLELLRS